MEENKEPCHKQARQFIYRALNHEEKSTIFVVSKS